MIRFARISRTAHRWLAWIVGLQVVVWLATGLVMSLLSSERVKRGLSGFRNGIYTDRESRVSH